MVDRPGLTTPEIADMYSVSLHTVTKSWAQHPEWPDALGKRGRYKEYAVQDIAAFVHDHVSRRTVDLEPQRLYTAQELEQAGIGITAKTIQADMSRHRWPRPDRTVGGVHRWYGQTAANTMNSRRGYHRRQSSGTRTRARNASDS